MDDLFKSIPKVLRAAGLAPEVAEAAAMAAWRRAAGEGLRWNAVPFRLYQKTLVVAVPDAGWQKQLEGMSGQLLFRINSMLGQAVVTFIEFRVDPKTVEKHRQIVGRQKDDHAEQEQLALRTARGKLKLAAKSIKDDALRHRFLIAAGSCLNRLEGEHKESGQT